ncbi:hypothetical protein QSJ19_13350 [Gordonia sp. ABSL11-1]|uniref:hypothetical protein n=1 Tax=Gordonia sp. ABSL11-1 TaxID=3053924 RepID=UPI00257242EB|nr:hypothetical protein [Gordonia sp. ABSL11-1]MDL9946560.1 hypothetical protein [Gordonia sp. ABSL11-1]
MESSAIDNPADRAQFSADRVQNLAERARCRRRRVTIVTVGLVLAVATWFSGEHGVG